MHQKHFTLKILHCVQSTSELQQQGTGQKINSSHGGRENFIYLVKSFKVASIGL